MSPNIKRGKVDVVDADVDKDRIRVYYSSELGLPPMPSVSVIKGLREDPDKEDALQGWRDRFDGQSSWSRPWWKDQQSFKAFRGTLVHFAILNELGDASGDTYFHEVGDDDYGYEEYYAEYCLKKWSKKAPSANSDDVPYSPRNNKYDGEHAWDSAMRGIKWATRMFKQAVVDGEQPDGVTIPDDSALLDGRFDVTNVIGVEEFVYDEDYGYAGQYDLLYTYVDGNGNERNVLADLKCSSAVRFDHKLQNSAYKRAIESSEWGPDTIHEHDDSNSESSTGESQFEIHECEIIRLYPDKEEVELSRSPQWDRTLDGLAHQFLGLCDMALNSVYSETLAQAQDELMETDTTESLIDDNGSQVQFTTS